MFFNKIQTLTPNIRQLPVNDLIIELMNSSIYFINIQLIKFISSCLIFETHCYQCDFIIFVCNLVLLSLILFFSFSVCFMLLQYFKVYSHANKASFCCCRRRYFKLTQLFISLFVSLLSLQSAIGSGYVIFIQRFLS